MKVVDDFKAKVTLREGFTFCDYAGGTIGIAGPLGYATIDITARRVLRGLVMTGPSIGFPAMFVGHGWQQRIADFACDDLARPTERA